jgi:hypothetical protein
MLLIKILRAVNTVAGVGTHDLNQAFSNTMSASNPSGVGVSRTEENFSTSVGPDQSSLDEEREANSSFF